MTPQPDFKGALEAIDEAVSVAVTVGFPLHDDPHMQTIRCALLIADKVMQHPDKDAETAAREFIRPYQDKDESWWMMNMPKDLFRLAFKAMRDHMLKGIDQ